MADALTLGVEEEFQIIHASTLELVPGFDALMRHATDAIRAQMHPEYYQCVLETATAVCSSMVEAERQSMALRATALAMAQKSHQAVVSAGAHPFSRWEQQPRSTDAAGRYAGLEDILQDVARSILIYGLHVHVGIASDSRRVAVMNQARAFLPHILALSVNSPFWQGRPTGYQSFRTIVWAPFPLANVPDLFPSADDYRAFRSLLESTSTLMPPRRIWWDIRVHHDLPTLEYRVADMPATHADTLAIAALIQALTKTLLDRLDHGNPLPAVPTPIIQENKWRAARWGLRGTFIDYTRGCDVPVVDLLAETFDLIEDSARQLGTEHYLARLRRMLEPGYRTGAERQLAAYEERHNLKDVVRLLVNTTAEGVAPDAAWPLANLSLLARLGLRRSGGPRTTTPAAQEPVIVDSGGHEQRAS